MKVVIRIYTLDYEVETIGLIEESKAHDIYKFIQKNTPVAVYNDFNHNQKRDVINIFVKIFTDSNIVTNYIKTYNLNHGYYLENKYGLKKDLIRLVESKMIIQTYKARLNTIKSITNKYNILIESYIKTLDYMFNNIDVYKVLKLIENEIENIEGLIHLENLNLQELSYWDKNIANIISDYLKTKHNIVVNTNTEQQIEIHFLPINEKHTCVKVTSLIPYFNEDEWVLIYASCLTDWNHVYIAENYTILLNYEKKLNNLY